MAFGEEKGVVKGNKKVLLKKYVHGFVEESDMEVVTNETILLELPQGSKGTVLVKNLYLSCDPFMRALMSKMSESHYIEAFVPGTVSLISLFNLCPFLLIILFN